MDKPYKSGLVWFRRDLRLSDHAAFSLAVQQCEQVHCLFVFDRAILDPLPRADRRVEFIRAALLELDEGLRRLAGHDQAGLIVAHGQSVTLVPQLARELGVQAVFAAQDYEPAAIERDDQVGQQLAGSGLVLHTCKDQVIFEKREILTRSATPYTVFTPYKKAWLAAVDDAALAEKKAPRAGAVLAARPVPWRRDVPSLKDIGFEASNLAQLKIPTGERGARQLLRDFFDRMDQYHNTRDFPAIKGPSYLSVHLRFGTVSVRHLAKLALQRMAAGSRGAETWLGELIWREFYFQLLANFPHVASGSFRPEYDAIAWEQGAQAQARFQAWCEGRTGYPLVDAAMAQLNQSGYMHNRLRMVSGSFLVKDLGIDWRWGERYFAEKLIDFDLSANNGGWQWVASSGCDAQPWFRIFNPVSQSEKFDPEGRFIRRYLPQLADLPNKLVHAPWLAEAELLRSAGVRLGENYPKPLVDHALARERTLERYSAVRAKSRSA